ncbi:hypothetical protein GCM10007036_31410 [Alsobacter metallidurans]|uniref:Uncharacterized protein n=2 Tax=Alsobacter metallidurans TaxID=340221 RepID=A0A917MIP3_9HYPH|nr:hypothetical protein GCM10007036_31410 [Alsobacter metallidurans]
MSKDLEDVRIEATAADLVQQHGHLPPEDFSTKVALLLVRQPDLDCDAFTDLIVRLYVKRASSSACN